MPDFAQYLRHAKSLPDKLLKEKRENIGCTTIFTSCLSSIGNDKSLKNAYLISEMAESIEKNKDLKPQKRIDILIGTYIYVLYQFRHSYEQITNKSLLKKLKSQLGIETLDNIKEKTFRVSLKELRKFCKWIYIHRNEDPLTKTLNEKLGQDIQSKIYHLLNDKPNSEKKLKDEVIGWIGSKLGFM